MGSTHSKGPKKEPKVKLSAYQKLKAKVAELEQEKRVLITRPNSIEAQRIIMYSNTNYEAEAALWFGSSNFSKEAEKAGITKADGLLSTINKMNKYHEQQH